MSAPNDDMFPPAAPGPFDWQSRLGLLAYKVTQLEEGRKEDKAVIASLKVELETLETTMAERERKQLVAGISALGGLVLTLFGLIWSYRSIIVRGP